MVRFDGTGHRRALTRQTASSRAALLEVKYTTGVVADLPICASDGVDRDGGRITLQGLIDECARVEATLESLAAPCGYPSECTGRRPAGSTHRIATRRADPVSFRPTPRR